MGGGEDTGVEVTRRTRRAGGQCQQMGVGHLALTDDQRNYRHRRAIRRQPGKQWPPAARDATRTRQYTGTPIALGGYFLGSSTPARPASVSRQVAQPSVALAANHSRIRRGGCAGPRQRDQCVDVEQRHRVSPHRARDGPSPGCDRRVGWNADHRQPSSASTRPGMRPRRASSGNRRAERAALAGGKFTCRGDASSSGQSVVRTA